MPLIVENLRIGLLELEVAKRNENPSINQSASAPVIMNKSFEDNFFNWFSAACAFVLYGLSY